MLVLGGILVLCYGVLSQDPYPTVDVDTEYGTVRGRVMSVHNGLEVSDIQVFQGVYYAKDTSGVRRFRKPERPDPYTEVLEAFTIGDACPQSPFIVRATNPDWDRFTENCLHLNIYTPSEPHESNGYAVMVWLHGGGYTSGSNFQYPGHFLATHRVIMVSVNYRLNKFGWAYCEKPECEGNYGMWDQNLAIQYVVDNIANYGGDPSRITVFGESAGAGSASLHVLSPRSKDLFHRAIMESGTEDSLTPPDSNPETFIYNAAENYGCPTDNEQDMMDCLREPSWEEIFYNTTFFGTGPVVDGGAYANPDDGFLPRAPKVLREEGNIMRGPIINGHNNDDFASGAFAMAPLSVLPDCCNRTYYERCMRENVVPMYFGRNMSDETAEKLYRALDSHYTPWPYLYNNYENKKRFVDISTDTGIGLSWNDHVKAHQEIAPVYAFIYNYRGRNTSMVVPEWLGVPHLGELPYVFGFTMLHMPYNEHVANDSTIHFDLIEWTEEDIAHTIFFQTCLTNFARFGNPTPTPVPNPLGETTIWPEYTWGDLRVLVISNTSIEAQTWREDTYAFWNQYTPYVSGETGSVHGFDFEKYTHREGVDPTTEYAKQIMEYLMDPDDFDEYDLYGDLFEF